MNFVGCGRAGCQQEAPEKVIARPVVLLRVQQPDQKSGVDLLLPLRVQRFEAVELGKLFAIQTFQPAQVRVVVDEVPQCGNPRRLSLGKQPS